MTQSVIPPDTFDESGMRIIHFQDVYIMNQRTERLNLLGCYRLHVPWTWDDPREKKNVGYIRRHGEMRQVVRIRSGWYLLPKRGDNSQTPEPEPVLSAQR